MKRLNEHRLVEQPKPSPKKAAILLYGCFAFGMRFGMPGATKNSVESSRLTGILNRTSCRCPCLIGKIPLVLHYEPTIPLLY